MLATGRENLWSLPLDLRAPEEPRTTGRAWRVVKHRLLRFTVSWRLTGSERSLQEALRTVDALLDQSFWTLKFAGAGLRHADLKTADLWFDACFAREVLASELNPAQSRGLEALLLEWALPAYLQGWADCDWWRHAEFNWGSAVHGCAGLAALSVRGLDPALSSRVLRKVREGIEFVTDAIPLGGGWIEGPMYEVTTWGHLTDFIAAHYRVTGDDFGLIGNRRVHDALDFRLRMLGLDQRPYNFSDSTEQSVEWSFPHGYWWARHCNRPEWAGFEDAYPKPWWDTHGVFLDLEALWMRKPHQPSQPYTAPSGLAHAREIDWLTWREGSTWFAMRSGWNGGNHCNLDLGHVIFGHGTERVLCDPGYGANATAQHNCVTVRGQDQLHNSRSRIFRTRRFGDQGRRVLYLCCDLSPTQPATVCYHYRHCIVGESGFLLLLDCLMARHGLRARAEGHLHFRQPLVLHDECIDLPESAHGFRARFLHPVRVPQTETWEWRQLAVHSVHFKAWPDDAVTQVAVLLTRHDPAHATLSGHGRILRFSHAGHTLEIDPAEGSCRLPDDLS
jgi:hypothetical protein